jgi:hypothetical protein
VSRAASGAVVTGAAPGYACVLCGLLVVCVVIRLGTRKTYIPSRARHVGDGQRYDGYLSIYLSAASDTVRRTISPPDQLKTRQPKLFFESRTSPPSHRTSQTQAFGCPNLIISPNPHLSWASLRLAYARHACACATLACDACHAAHTLFARCVARSSYIRTEKRAASFVPNCTSWLHTQHARTHAHGAALPTPY